VSDDYGTIGPPQYGPGAMGMFHHLLGIYGGILSGAGSAGEALGASMQGSPFPLYQVAGKALRSFSQQGSEYGKAYTDWSQGYAPMDFSESLTNPVVNREQLMNVIRGAVPAARVAQAIPGAVRDASRDFMEGIPQGFPGITAYHGTPHIFEPTPKNPLGEFNPEKIGSGEGAQAYGHGIYVAEDPRVAGTYRMGAIGARVSGDPLDPAVQTKLDAAMYHANGDIPTATAWLQKQQKILARNAKGMTSILEQQDNAYYANATQQALDAIQAGRVSLKEAPGGLYQLDISDEHIERMLDWDKPLSEQPHILEKLQKAVGDNPDVQDFLPNATGEDIYNRILPMIGVGRGGPGGYQPDMASDWLHGMGVPGIKYFDAGSRGAGTGTRNFVLFDPSIATITGRK